MANIFKTTLKKDVIADIANNNVREIRFPITKFWATRLADEYDIDAGYIYNIDVKQKFRIPLAYIDAALPQFNPIREMSATAGSVLNVKITAESSLGREITY